MVKVRQERDPPKTLSKKTLLSFDATETSLYMSLIAAIQLKVPIARNHQYMKLTPSKLAISYTMYCGNYRVAIQMIAFWDKLFSSCVATRRHNV